MARQVNVLIFRYIRHNTQSPLPPGPLSSMSVFLSRRIGLARMVQLSPEEVDLELTKVVIVNMWCS